MRADGGDAATAVTNRGSAASDSRAAATARCGCCEEPIPTGRKRCPICGYQPAGYDRRLTLLGELGFAALLVAAITVFSIGVGGAVLDVPVGAFSQLAIVTPYMGGFSGFFTYYLHQKRRLTPTDDQVFD